MDIRRAECDSNRAAGHVNVLSTVFDTGLVPGWRVGLIHLISILYQKLRVGTSIA
jgi:hypothetical protein